MLVLPIHTCHMYVHVRSTTANARYAINTNCSKKIHRVLVSRMCYALHIRAYGYYCLFFVYLFSLLHPPVTLFSFLSDRERSIDVSHVQELYESGEQVFFSSVRVQHQDFFLAFSLHNLGRRMLLVKCIIFIFRITCKVQYTFRATVCATLGLVFGSDVFINSTFDKSIHFLSGKVKNVDNTHPHEKRGRRPDSGQVRTQL